MKEISPRGLARSLGVSESSVKRWVDDGALSARRTTGGHRRIAVAEAVRFVRQSGAAVVRPDLIFGAGPATAPETFDPATSRDVGYQFLALLRQDEVAEARAFLLGLFLAGWPVAALGDGPIRFALEEIGTLWRHGPAGIVTEHRATDTCVRALSEMRALFPPPAADAPVAIGAAPSDDPYILPSMMVATVLADLGYRDHNLGPDTPIAALDDAVDRYHPRIVWLSLSVAPDDARLRGTEKRLAAGLLRRGATLIVGGRGAPPMPPRPGLLPIHSMTELAAFARGALAGSG